MVIPKRCLKCGSVFDLSYDFIEGEEPSFMSKKVIENPSEFLCYYCRDQKESIRGEGKKEQMAWLTDEILTEEEY